MKSGMFPSRRGNMIRRKEWQEVSTGRYQYAIGPVQAVTSQNQDRLQRGKICKAQKSVTKKRLSDHPSSSR